MLLITFQNKLWGEGEGRKFRRSFHRIADIQAAANILTGEKVVRARFKNFTLVYETVWKCNFTETSGEK